MKKTSIILALAALTALSACSSHYQLTQVSRTRVLIDGRYDRPGSEAETFLAPAARYMASHRPESELSNLLSDILVWGAARMGERADFAVYNMGGIRAALAKGQVTIGDVLDVAPFENKLCVLTLTGDKVTELFTQIASVGGEGVSHGVALTISRDGRLLSATVGGQPIDPKRDYRIATLDYLAQGNDRLVAFKAKSQVVAPQEQDNNVRYIIMDYFRAQGTVDAHTEGRIAIK